MIMKALLCIIFLLQAPLQPVIGQTPHFQQHFLTGRKNEVFQVNAILQDRTGYIWFATSKGLFRYDGIQAHRFTTENGLPDQRVTAIAEDAEGRIWTGYQNGKIAIIQNQTVENFNPHEGTSTERISDILFDSQGNLWFSTWNDGLYYYTQDRLYRIDEEEGLPDLYVYDLEEDPFGNIWAGTDRGVAICSLTDKKVSIRVIDQRTGLPDNIVRKIKREGNTAMWLALEDAGIITVSIPDNRFEGRSEWNHGPVEDFILRDDHIWIASRRNGLLICDREGNLIRSYEIQKKADHATILFNDREGNIWAASRNGIWHTPGDHLRFVIPEFPADVNVLAVTADREGSIWFATSEGLFRRRLYADTRTAPVEKPLEKTPYAKYTVISLYTDSQGYIWAGLYGEGVLMIDPVTGTIMHVQKELRNGNVLNINGKGDVIWLATLGGGTRITRSGQKFAIQNFSSSDGLVSDFIYHVFTDSRGRVWFGTDGKGAGVMDEQGFHHIEEGLPSKVVFGFAEDAQGRIWANIQGSGLYILEGNTFTPAASAYPVRDHSIQCLTSDNKGNIVVLHELGMDVIDVRKNKVLYFGEESGLRDKIPNLNAIAGTGSNGILIGTSGGIIIFSPDLVQDSDLPKPTIGAFRVFGQEKDIVLQDKLSYDENNITIDYLAFWYRNPQALQFRYRLDQYDRDWVTTQNRSVTYPRLPPGDYTFRILATEAYGVHSTEETLVSFTILPPFWQTVSFYILVAGMSVVLVAAYIRYRERKLLRDKAILEHEVRIRTEQIQRSNEEIQAQNEEIIAQAEEIKGINENLEMLVQQRTAELEKKNKALEEYYFINAHKLRSPLASILGLVHLISRTPLTQEGQEICERLQAAADELDNVIRYITRTIEKGQ